MSKKISVSSDIGWMEVLQTQQRHSSECFIPQRGRKWSEIRAELITRKLGDFNWRDGRVPIYVYHDDDELLSVSRDAYSLYFSENALGRSAFPSLAQMEEEVVCMSRSLFRAPEGAQGSFTSGGTESIFLALKAARDRFRRANGSAHRPKAVVPITAHPAFDKAGHYLDVEIVRIPVAKDLRADVGALQKAIDSRTIMIVGSAPCYPYGVIDPIPQLAELAVARSLWLHVDACLGGFLAPFVRDEGFSVVEFDFCLPGVMSLSADLHKYGFCARGASVIIYRDAALHAYQGFHFDNWPRGSYSTDTFLGSRSGGAIAAAWAVLHYLGVSGYRRLARKIMDAKQRLVSGIERISGLEVVYPSDLSILLYRSVDSRLDISAIAETLSEKGWFVGRSREPAAIHLALNAVHAPIIDEYLCDLLDSVNSIRATGRRGTYNDATY